MELIIIHQDKEINLLFFNYFSFNLIKIIIKSRSVFQRFFSGYDLVGLRRGREDGPWGRDAGMSFWFRSVELSDASVAERDSAHVQLESLENGDCWKLYCLLISMTMNAQDYDINIINIKCRLP